MKRLICIIIALFALTVTACCTDEFEIDALIENAPQNVSEAVSEADDAKNLLSIGEILNFVSGNIISCVKDNVSLLCSMTAVLIIMGVYDVLGESFSGSQTSKIADFACVSLIGIMVCAPLTEVVQGLVAAVEDTAGYVRLSVPVFAAILTAQGNVTAASLFQLFLYNGTAVIAQIFTSFAMPLCGTYIAVGLASAVTDNSGIRNLTSGLKNTVNKVIITVSTLFTGLLSLQNMLGKSGDMLSKKALKLAVGSALPVGGSVLSDSVDAFWESLGVIKSAGGVIAIAAVFYFVAAPALKALVNSWCIRLCALAGSLIGSKRASDMLNIVADAYSMLLTAAFAVTAILIISIGILLSVGGASH